MRSDSTTEKIPVVPGHGNAALIHEYKENSDIRRKRTTILILLGIQLVLAVIYFILKLVDLIRHNRLPEDPATTRIVGSDIGSVIVALITLVYLIVFIIAVAKYNRIGILVFAWLGLLQLIFVLIILILGIVTIISASSGVGGVGVGIAISIIVIIITAVVLLLAILSVVFSFQLAKLLKQHEAYRLV